MLSSLYSGISGLMANSQAISVIGNNIANTNTIGYKGSRTTFGDVLYQSIFGMAGSSQVGRGTALTSVDTLFEQGSFESTSEPTDLAIGGNGFFIVRSPENNQNYYTRAGQFRFDKDGNLTTPTGYKLQGRMCDRSSGDVTGVPVDIVVPLGFSEPRASGSIGMAVNLKSNTLWAGGMPSLEPGHNIIGLQASNEGYPITGDYTTAISAATGTGSGLVDPGGVTGTVTINGTAVTLDAGTTGANAAAIVAAINGTAGINVTASEGAGGHIILTANKPNFSISVRDGDDGATLGKMGWSPADIANKDLTGAKLSVTVAQRLRGELTGKTEIFSDVLKATNNTIIGDTARNFAGSGLDITYNEITNEDTQSFAINGFDVNNPGATSNYSSSVTVYDLNGRSHVVSMYFRKSDVDTSGYSNWEYHAYVNAGDSSTRQAVDVAAGYLTFDQSGHLVHGGEPIPIKFAWDPSSSEQTIMLNLGSGSGGGSTTQYPIASTTNFQTQDGYPPGVLNNVSVSQEGIISGHYSNGRILPLYQITLANFNNPQSLSREGQNLFSETLGSGVAYTNAPGEGSLGKINPNSLEQSNVDLASEFVKMIITQRGYQANARIITTTDEMLAELMNIKR